MLTYYRCARAYGWTPDEVDRQDPRVLESLLVLDDVYHEIAEYEAEKRRGRWWGR